MLSGREAKPLSFLFSHLDEDMGLIFIIDLNHCLHHLWLTQADR